MRKNNAAELADKMMKEFSKGGCVILDDYTPEEIKDAQRIYDEKQKHKAPNNLKDEIKGKWREKCTQDMK